ncbi:CRM-domain containing factor CFM3, chloroplastic/mitochondrial [Linum perenne]
MSLHLHSSPHLLHPFLPQIRTWQFRTCPPRVIRVNTAATAETRRKLRSSFLEEVQHKWSRKQSSTREHFPWQQQNEIKDKEENPVDVQTPATPSVSDEFRPGIRGEPSTSTAVSFPIPNRSSSAPWVQGDRARNSHSRNLGFHNALFQVSVDNPTVNGVVDDMAESAETKADCSAKKNVEKLEQDESSSRSSVQSPWNFGMEKKDEKKKNKVSNTEVAERTLPGHELNRLRNVALRMFERIKVGASGVNQDLVDAIHEKWTIDEVVKLKFEGPPSRNMKRIHDILESRTGGLVIWRSGTSVVLFRGMTYFLQCVRSYPKQREAVMEALPSTETAKHDSTAKKETADIFRTLGSSLTKPQEHSNSLSQSELMDLSELNYLLDSLGRRFKDWGGCEPSPVDADLLPAVVPGYKPPLRLLPYGVKHCLRDKETTKFRRLARMTPPHFALGRSRDLQGLAKAIVKLWEQSAIAKIAIKRGVENTRNERMAEELKRLTGGTLLSRNKEFIVFYRGNDFLPPAVMETLKERQKLNLHQHVEEEEQVRRMAPLNIRTTQLPAAVAGTLAETVAATSRWGKQPSSEDLEEMMRGSDVAKISSLLKYLQNKLAIAKGKLKKAEKALYKVQEHLEPKELPSDLETITNEERFLFRRIGLSMKSYLPLGRREVYDGTIENMHLHWKFHELVKIIVTGKNAAQVKQIAISLEAESGGVLVSVDRLPKGYAIIIYRGKNYKRPLAMRPKNLLSRRQALARSIELQRREALKHHVLDLQERMELIKSELEDIEAGKSLHTGKSLKKILDDVGSSLSDEEGGQEG